MSTLTLTHSTTIAQRPSDAIKTIVVILQNLYSFFYRCCTILSISLCIHLRAACITCVYPTYRLRHNLVSAQRVQYTLIRLDAKSDTTIDEEVYSEEAPKKNTLVVILSINRNVNWQIVIVRPCGESSITIDDTAHTRPIEHNVLASIEVMTAL